MRWVCFDPRGILSFSACSALSTWLCAWLEKTDGQECTCTDQSRCRYGEDPRHDDATCDSPADRRQSGGGAYTDNCSSYGVSRAYRNTRQRSGKQSDCPGSLCAKSPDGPKFRDSGAHCMNNSPAAEIGPQSYCCVRGENDRPMKAPPTTSKLGSCQVSRSEKRGSNNPHSLLRVVAAVPDAVRRGSQKMATIKEKPSTRPISGATKIKSRVLDQPAGMITPNPERMMAAPA